MTLNDPYRDRPRHPGQQAIINRRFRQLLETYEQKTPTLEPEPFVDLTRTQTRRLLKRLQRTLDEISYAEVEIGRLRRCLLASQQRSSHYPGEREDLKERLESAIAANKLLSEQYFKLRSQAR